ncbi:MAG: hypothetical protein ACFFCC_01040 [Promethearchaeota archaeon]
MILSSPGLCLWLFWVLWYIIVIRSRLIDPRLWGLGSAFLLCNYHMVVGNRFFRFFSLPGSSSISFFVLSLTQISGGSALNQCKHLLAL